MNRANLNHKQYQNKFHPVKWVNLEKRLLRYHKFDIRNMIRRNYGESFLLRPSDLSNLRDCRIRLKHNRNLLGSIKTVLASMNKRLFAFSSKLNIQNSRLDSPLLNNTISLVLLSLLL